MAVTLRLARRGTTHRPYYHIVAADKRARRDGRYLDQIGRYDPLGTTDLSVDEEKALKWLRHGAAVSPTVDKLLRRAGVKWPETATESPAV
jgi:small subunit ribosomal protein S16